MTSPISTKPKFAEPGARIKLRCPKCSRQRTVPRMAMDPDAAVRLEIACPSCTSGDFAYPTYYDAQGRHINEETGRPFSEQPA